MSASESAVISKRQIWVILGLTIILGFCLRIWGIGFGLPYEYHVDESQYVRQAASMGSVGLEPADWFNPPFLKYILLGEFGLLYVVGKTLGIYASITDFGNQMTLDPTWLYLLGRFTSVIFGTLTILLVYWIGNNAYNRRVGILGAFFIAVAFLPVRESHFAVNDAAVTFWITLSLLAAVKIIRTVDWRWYAIGGIAIGFGFATKYSALIAVLPILIAHLYTPGAVRSKHGYTNLGMLFVFSIASALLASPYFVLTPGNAWAYASELILAGQEGAGTWLVDPGGGFIYYLKTLLWGLGLGLLLLSFAGIIIALIRHDPIDIVLVSLPIIMFFYLGRQQLYFGRFMLPAIPPMLILSASLLEKFVVSLFLSHRNRRIAYLIILILLVVQPLSSSIRFGILSSRIDTRTLAKQWIEDNIQEDSSIAMDWQYHCAPLSTKENPIANAKHSYRIWFSDLGFGKGLFEHPLEWYQKNGFDYLMACSFLYRIPLIDEDENIQRVAYYRSLGDKLTPLKEFHANDGSSEPDFIFDEIYGPAVSLWQRERPGPTLVIYQFAYEEQ